MSELITETKLRQLAGEWIDGGKRVVGPVRIKDRVLYRPLQSPESLLLESNPGALRPANSIKEFFFPKQETLYQYRIQGRNIELIEPAQEFAEQLIIAARPCDAAALPILDHVFNWDFVDDFYNRRRAATTIVTVACSAADESCFCTSVGLAPDATRGSDAILLRSRRRPLRGAMHHRERPGAVLRRRLKLQRNRGRPRRLPNPSSIPARFELLSTATSRIRSGLSTGEPAWHAAFVHSPVPRATASTSSTPGRSPATLASGPGTHASSRSSRCTLPDTIPERFNPRGSGSVFCTSFQSIRKSSATSSAPAAVIAYATARWVWAC